MKEISSYALIKKRKELNSGHEGGGWFVTGVAPLIQVVMKTNKQTSGHLKLFFNRYLWWTWKESIHFQDSDSRWNFGEGKPIRGRAEGWAGSSCAEKQINKTFGVRREGILWARFLKKSSCKNDIMKSGFEKSDQQPAPTKVTFHPE